MLLPMLSVWFLAFVIFMTPIVLALIAAMTTYLYLAKHMGRSRQ